jgi:hypothetical protein
LSAPGDISGRGVGTATAGLLRPSESVPKKMPKVTARISACA